MVARAISTFRPISDVGHGVVHADVKRGCSGERERERAARAGVKDGREERNGRNGWNNAKN